MVDSTSVRPLAWRWSRRVASVLARGVLAAVSAIVAAYGMVQLTFVGMTAMLPLPRSPLPSWMSLEEMMSVLEAIPPVRLVGPLMVDPVLNTTSLSTVGVSVGIVALGAAGMSIAGTVPQRRWRTSAAKEESLSAGLPSVHDVFSDAFAVFQKSQSEVAQGAGTFFVATTACIFMSWTATDILIPQVADAGGIVILLLLTILVRIIPVVGVVCAMLAVGHAIWYAGLRWRGTRRVAGGET
jgi:hypothetical protein